MKSAWPLNRDICFRCWYNGYITKRARLFRERRAKILFDFVWDFHQIVECPWSDRAACCGTYLLSDIEVIGQPISWSVPDKCKYRLEHIMAVDESVSV